MDSDFGPIRKIREIRSFGPVFAVLSGFGAILWPFLARRDPAKASGSPPPPRVAGESGSLPHQSRLVAGSARH